MIAANLATAPAPATDVDAEKTRDLSASYLKWRADLQRRQGREGEPLPALPKVEAEFYTIVVMFQGVPIRQPAQVVERCGNIVRLCWNGRTFVRFEHELEKMSRMEAFELGMDERED